MSTKPRHPRWHIFRPDREPAAVALPVPPPWRDFRAEGERAGVEPIDRAVEPEDDRRGLKFRMDDPELEVVNAAIHLRRPLLVTGQPGSGKSSLAYAVAYRLKLGKVLRWSINSRSTLKEGLYEYDAVARLRALNVAALRASARGNGTTADATTTTTTTAQASAAAGGVEPDSIGRYLRLGPLGTALLPTTRPRVLLVDEIDKSDIDLPNDLLHVFEEGRFRIDELSRIAKDENPVAVQPFDERGPDDVVSIHDGWVRCLEFPLVILTSNGERDLPPAFLRRCLRLDIPPASSRHIEEVVDAHLDGLDPKRKQELIQTYLGKDRDGVVALDQLLNALFLLGQGRVAGKEERERVLQVLMRELESR